MDNSLFKHLPQVLRRYGHQFFRPFELAVTSPSRLVQGIYLLWRDSIFPLGIVRRFDLYFAQSDDIRPANDANILPLSSVSEPTAKIFFRIGDCESLHRVYI